MNYKLTAAVQIGIWRHVSQRNSIESIHTPASPLISISHALSRLEVPRGIALRCIASVYSLKSLLNGAANVGRLSRGCTRKLVTAIQTTQISFVTTHISFASRFTRTLVNITVSFNISGLWTLRGNIIVRDLFNWINKE